MSENRINISSGSPREPVLGYSRAVRVGNQIFVAGTTSGGVGDDAAAQTREIFSRIETALKEGGASFEDVVRTRVYLTNIADFDAVGAIHGEIFGGIRPVTAVVEVNALAAPNLLVEIEADAFITA
ncbi:RidA family protein [Paenarthrobacter sp. A20]|uniref:RidA family protein n=1 Tax=Paenarthrobacter sp. A20 TaxID=2817891 RepID=UPI00209D20AF|nr:RidA family protein [Paenarthrobacter sp. A20]MCP1415592.1 enamine deaminase RidA (YjgF/YER057c/UK114 family) [Paenarthrobacter sp. A20]